MCSGVNKTIIYMLRSPDRCRVFGQVRLNVRPVISPSRTIRGPGQKVRLIHFISPESRARSHPANARFQCQSLWWRTRQNVTGIIQINDLCRERARVFTLRIAHVVHVFFRVCCAEAKDAFCDGDGDADENMYLMCTVSQSACVLVVSRLLCVVFTLISEM